MKVRVFVPLPDVYDASLSVSPVSSSRVGVPVTVTALLKVTWMVMVSPTFLGPVLEVVVVVA